MSTQSTAARCTPAGDADTALAAYLRHGRDTTRAAKILERVRESGCSAWTPTITDEDRAPSPPSPPALRMWPRVTREAA